jgi:hypothetical protein
VQISGQNSGITSQLIRDLDGDGVIDGNEILSSRSGSGTFSDSASLNAGLYFVVLIIDGIGNATPYSMTITPL